MKNPPPDARSVSHLREIQRVFGTAIMRPLTADSRMQARWVDGRPARDVAGSFIKPNDRLESFERLEIYNRQYWFRIINSFYEDFPGLLQLLGERKFHKLTLAYLARHPSRSFDLRNLGSRLEAFLKKEPRWTAPHAALAREIVRLEWAHIVAFDEEALPPLEVDDLLDSDPASLRVRIQPHVTFLACHYPVDEFLLSIRKRTLPQAETSNAVSETVRVEATARVPRPKPEKIWLAVHRSDNSVYYKRLERGAFLIVSALRRGATLQAACEKALSAARGDDSFPEKLQGWFAQWTSFGWLCRRPE
jgi:hypothetical protein